MFLRGRQYLRTCRVSPSCCPTTEGGEVLDLQVAPEHRRRGVAALLIVAVCKEMFAVGGRFLRGGALDSGPSIACTADLFPRSAMTRHSGGRAFRRLAELGGASARELVRSLPKKAWNFEA